MRTKKLVSIFLLIALTLISCNSMVEECFEQEVPVNLERSTQGDIDLETLLDQMYQRIKDKLPDAEYAATTYKTSCRDLNVGSGQITFLFIAERKNFMGINNQVILSRASVNIKEELGEISINDETRNNPSLVRYRKISNTEFYKLIEVIEERLLAKKIRNCSLEITQLANYWHILVGSHNSGYIDEFGVDLNNRVIQPEDLVTQ